MAKKRSGGSSKNGRTANPKFLGVKKFGGEIVKAGAIIIRQKGTAVHAGQYVGCGRDHTLYALIAGRVYFRSASQKRKNSVSIVPQS